MLFRSPGASLVDHPDRPGQKALLIRRVADRSLTSENQGAVWNFPAGLAGSLTVRVRHEKGGQGGRISLLDRWVNPGDPVVTEYSMFDLTAPGDGAASGGIRLTPGRWHEIRFEWDGLREKGADRCRVLVDGVPQKAGLPLNRASVNGISYVHLQSIAGTEDTAGFLVESVAAEAR